MNGETGDKLFVPRHMVTRSTWSGSLSLPAHTPLGTVKGFTLSLAKQVVSGNMDDVIETAKDNVRLL